MYLVKINNQNVWGLYITQHQKIDPIKNWRKDLNRNLRKENIRNANSSPSLITTKMQSKPQWRVTSSALGRLLWKDSEIASPGEKVEKRELWHSAGVTGDCAPLWEPRRCAYAPTFPSMGIHYTEMKSSHHKGIYLHSEVTGQYLQKLRYENNHNVHQGWVVRNYKHIC